MSSENSRSNGSNFPDCLYVPLTLLALAFAFFLLLQQSAIQQSKETMKVQLAALETRSKNLKESNEKLDKSIEDRKALVDQSEQTQKLFTEIMADLIELAKEDKEAKAIVDGYGIRVTPPAASSEVPKPETPVPATSAK